MSSAIQPKRQNCPFTQPAPQQTICCRLLIVGGSVAAYAATLAALEAGENLYLVQPHHCLGGQYDQRLIASWNHGQLLRQPPSKHTLSGEAFAISRLQRQFRQIYQALEGQSAENRALLRQRPALKAAALSAALRSLLAPYLKTGRCRVIANAIPVMTLYATARGQSPQVKQILFQDRVRQCQFKILSQVTIDCSGESSLLSLAPDLSVDPLARTWETLTPETFLPTSRGDTSARGRCFKNTVGIAEVGHWHPLGPKQLPPIRQPRSWPQPLQPLWSRWLQTRLVPSAIRGLPITLPLGCFIPQALEGMITAGQQLGTTAELEALGQFFPVAWATGETSGHLAAFVLKSHRSLHQLAIDPTQWPYLQRQLLRQRIPLFWFDDVSTADDAFEAIQQLAIQNIFWPQNHRNLHFGPEKIVSCADLTHALINLLQPEGTIFQPCTLKHGPVKHWADHSAAAVAQGWLSAISTTDSLPDTPLTAGYLRTLMADLPSASSVTVHLPVDRSATITRRHLAKCLYAVWQHLNAPLANLYIN
jgi:hypothetical protein